MSNDTAPAYSKSRLIPAADWNKHHQWPPIAGLRHLIFHEHSNGFSKVTRRVGRRVLIDEAAFFQWVGERDAISKEKAKQRAKGGSHAA